MSAFQLNEEQFVQAYQGLYRQLNDLNDRLKTMDGHLTSAKKTDGGPGAYRAVATARTNASQRSKDSYAEVMTLRNELSTFLHNAHAAYTAYGNDSAQGAATFKGLASGLTGDAGKSLSPEAQAEAKAAQQHGSGSHSAASGSASDTTSAKDMGE